MQKVRFLRSVSLDNGERNGVHLGYQRYAVGDVVELSDTSVARWLKRETVELVSEEVKSTPAAKTSEAKAVPAVKPGGVGAALTSEISEEGAVIPASLPPFGTPAKK